MSEFLYFESEQPHTCYIIYMENDFLDKIRLSHLIQSCKSKPSTIIPKGQNVSANTTGIKCKFGIQVPKGINNSIKLGKKNGNNV
jgi:hypothetical protein